MKEPDFSLYDRQRKIRIEGGILWKMEPRSEDGQMWKLDAANKTLSLYLQPGDQLQDVKEHLFELVRHHNALLHLYFELLKRLPSLLILVPASLTVWLIAFGGVFTDSATAVTFADGDGPTIFGISRLWLFLSMGAIATILLYTFPAFFSGEQEGFIQYINNRFSQRSIVRERFRKVFNFLKSQGKIERVFIWNPALGEEKTDWVMLSLVPAAVDSSVELILEINIDERNAAQNYIARITKRQPDDIDWEESYNDTDAYKTIPYEYLQNWEKRLLAVYTFASTANLPEDWKGLEGGLQDAVSLHLVEAILDRFKQRLFAEADLQQLISLDTFTGRCVNDLGVLEPCLNYSVQTNTVWELADAVVESELSGAREEMRYVYSFLEMHIDDFVKSMPDPIIPLLINSLYIKTSIYNESRLQAVRYFIQAMRDLEQYRLFKTYWPLVARSTTPGTTESDLYRVLGVSWLIDLAALFEKAALYDRAWAALDFVEKVFPYRGKVGKARVSERRGDYLGSTLAMLDVLNSFADGQIVLEKSSQIDLLLNIAWAVVSGRLEAHRSVGLQSLEQAQTLLDVDYDRTRSSEQMIRLYNITANYEEWAGNPQGSIANYDKALQIPGAEQAGLSNLLVNKGIALRQVGNLSEAAYYGEQGCEIKAAIGDMDQLPIALHNLAQTLLLLAASLPPEQRPAVYAKALQQAQHGLSIQDQTGSVKKRGQLLAERFVACSRLGQSDAQTLQQQKQAVLDWLQAERQAGRAQSYDYRVVEQELLPMA